MNYALRNKRLSLKLTQQQVAEKSHILLQQYQKFESGERDLANASFLIACRVLDALEIDVSKYYKMYANTIY